ncbi:MAG: hypothetical protein M3R27_16295, partial [Bacteroidota bacterium]|nr:hypothetical protein [Bacteroidota bacterium]
MVLIICAFTSIAQSGFYKKFSGFNLSYQVKVVAMSDGGWVTGGSTPLNKLRLIRFDKCGNQLWSNEYDGGTLMCLDFIASKSGGIIATGYGAAYP